MRRKLWLLLILFLFLVGRESYCASSAPAQEQNQEQAAVVQQIGGDVGIVRSYILTVLFLSPWYWYFDLHQKKKGRYTCKFYYAVGYRTKLFYNRIYLDFYYSLFWLLGGLNLLIMNINIRIYRDFYIVLPIPVLSYLLCVCIYIIYIYYIQ